MTLWRIIPFLRRNGRHPVQQFHIRTKKIQKGKNLKRSLPHVNFVLCPFIPPWPDAMSVAISSIEDAWRDTRRRSSLMSNGMSYCSTSLGGAFLVLSNTNSIGNELPLPLHSLNNLQRRSTRRRKRVPHRRKNRRFSSMSTSSNCLHCGQSVVRVSSPYTVCNGPYTIHTSISPSSALPSFSPIHAAL